MEVRGQSKTVLIPAGVPLLLRNLVHERTGIFFEPERVEDLVEKLEPLAEKLNFHSLLEYYYILKFDENGPQDWADVMDVLCVPETYFFRETPQIRLLTDVLVPKWFQNSPTRTLKIWSAACASGEEPYTILISLLEAGWGEHPIEIHASDASPAMLERARRAVYREKSVRNLSEALREKYFLRTEGFWQLRPEYARRVVFQRANLLSTEEISSLARSPFVFCRNVFIYFSPHTIRQVLAAFASRMPMNGHLFVGASESLLRLTADFELREMGETFAYVRT